MFDEKQIIEEFHEAKRESKKLSLALFALDDSMHFSNKDREECLNYLKTRKRSAALMLIENARVKGLMKMEELGLLDHQYMKEYKKLAGDHKEVEVWAYLLKLEDAMCATPSEVGYDGLCDKKSLARRSVRLTIKSLVTDLPGFGPVFSALTFKPDSEHVFDDKVFLAGDGLQAFYKEDAWLAQYAENTDYVRRCVLHMVLHNLLFHPLQGAKCQSDLFNLASDIVVERMIDGWKYKKADRDREEYRRLLLKEYGIRDFPKNVCSLYRELELLSLPKDAKEKLTAEFQIDDHHFWVAYRDALKDMKTDAKVSTSAASLQKIKEFVSFWGQYREELGAFLQESGQRRGSHAGSGMQKAHFSKKAEYDYRSFLTDLMVCKEEMELDMDSFDYLPYWYSREHYEDIVMLEPLEYSELYRLDEMVIAIDTSGSCSGQIVQKFLEETWQIITQRGNFFRKMQLHLVQCDAAIQDYRLIRNKDEFLEYMDHVTVKGLGGTDFRPVFRLIDRLVEEKEIQNLRGLLYFTDGDGIYPETAPNYETAFVYINKQLEKKAPPAWAINLNLQIAMETSKV